VTLFRASPETPTAKAKMALASLVSSQKQKHDSKNHLAANILKTVFQRGNNRAFIVSLVDTRFVIFI
jgi:hypothetical protein